MRRQLGNLKAFVLPLMVLPLVLRALSRFALPSPPAGNAPGLIVLEYFVGGRPLHLNLHLQELAAAGSTNSGNSLPDWDYNNTNQLLWTFESTSNESSVQDTVSAFLNTIKGAYDPTVNFTIKSLWRRETPESPLVEVFPTPATGTIAGTGAADSTPTADDPGCFSQHVLACRSGRGGNYRLALVGAAPTTLAKPVALSANAAGTPFEKLCAYVRTTHCRIQGHDGGKPTGAMRMHVGPNAKLRRSFKFA